MVGIFLRLLEYHQGVLFLTTNRVKCFDKAFHSRISIAIKYEDLQVDSRTQIWATLLKVAHISDIKPEELCNYDLNGYCFVLNAHTPRDAQHDTARHTHNARTRLTLGGTYSRQIRTIIRLALALAKTEGVAVNKSHLERTIKVALQFAADLENAFE
jgi:hypothetical protein